MVTLMSKTFLFRARFGGQCGNLFILFKIYLQLTAKNKQKIIKIYLQKYMYTYIYTHTHIHTYTYIYIYIYLSIYTYMHTDIKII